MRGLLLDIGGVILRTEDPEPRRRWERRLEMNPGDLANLVFGNEMARKATLGLADEDAVWAEAGRLLRLSPADQQSLRDDFFSGDCWDTRLIGFVRSLRPRIRTGILSNAWTGARKNFTAWISADAFDALTYSCEIGVQKPEPRAYQEAVVPLGCPVADVVFVDDFPENVTGAERAGLSAVRFMSTNQLVEDIARRLSE